MSFSYQSFVEQKVKTAQAIAAGCCEGTYAEGALILCGVISAMSAIAWPGEGKDRKRFVEIITRFSPPGIEPKKVSGPLLVQDGKVCNSMLGIPNLSFKLNEANDHDEEEVVRLCPILKLSEVRKYSYANLLYEQIRCGYMHQYMIGSEASDHDQLRRKENIKESDISYVNVNRDITMYRLIHFPICWIGSIANGIAQGLDNEPSKKGKMPFDDLCLRVPTRWWLEG